MQTIFDSESMGTQTKEVTCSVESRAFFMTTQERFKCSLKHTIVLDLQNMLNAGKSLYLGDIVSCRFERICWPKIGCVNIHRI